ncbi:MAG: peptidoglycan endopeptidase [Sphingobium sp.]|nr:peptidoglycan endopeptidase [Sphingobium sp.]
MAEDRDVGQAIVDAARTCVGGAFRLHGRDPATGLDCVGLVVCALEGAGCRRAAHVVPTGYHMRGGNLAQQQAALIAAGLQRASNHQPGDIVMVRPGPAQHHLMVATGEGFIHAHAGLRRVVEMPGLSPWPVISVWRSFP